MEAEMEAEKIIIIRHAPYIIQSDDEFAADTELLTKDGYKRAVKFLLLTEKKSWVTDWQKTYCACSTAPRACQTIYAIMRNTNFELSRFHSDQSLANERNMKYMLDLVLKKAEKYKTLFLITHLDQCAYFHEYFAEKIWQMKSVGIANKYSLLKSDEKAPLSATIIDVKKKRFGVMLAE